MAAPHSSSPQSRFPIGETTTIRLRRARAIQRWSCKCRVEPNENIEPQPSLDFTADTRPILNMVKIGEAVEILMNTNHLLSGADRLIGCRMAVIGPVPA
jgi:hypothetical protein